MSITPYHFFYSYCFLRNIFSGITTRIIYLNKLHKKSGKGITLLVSIITTSMLLLVSFVLVNIALKELILSYANQESQYAFYAADSGIECVLYWDLKNPAGPSAFATSTAGTISCNGQSISTGSETSIPPPSPRTTSLIGGGGNSNPTSVFLLNFSRGCAIVQVTKGWNGSKVTSDITSRGYNTCDTSATRRFERGIGISY